MILLILALLSVTVIALWLAYELVKCQKRVSYKNECLVAYKERTEEYWLKYLDMQSKNRSKALLIKELKEESAELESQLADALHEAESFRELAKERSEEIEKQKEQIKSLKNELENEFDWSMRYSESVDKYGALYLEALQKADELEESFGKMIKQHEHEREFWYLEHQRQLDKIHELEVKNEHFKHELEYYRQKFDGDYDPKIGRAHV